MDKSDKIIKKIMEDMHAGKKQAMIVSEKIGTIRAELQPCVAAWKNDKMLEFSFQDITLQEIMEKEKVGYLEAIFRMNVLMNRPELAAEYKSMVFIRK